MKCFEERHDIIYTQSRDYMEAAEGYLNVCLISVVCLSLLIGSFCLFVCFDYCRRWNIAREREDLKMSTREKKRQKVFFYWGGKNYYIFVFLVLMHRLSVLLGVIPTS